MYIYIYIYDISHIYIYIYTSKTPWGRYATFRLQRNGFFEIVPQVPKLAQSTYLAEWSIFVNWAKVPFDHPMTHPGSGHPIHLSVTPKV